MGDLETEILDFVEQNPDSGRVRIRSGLAAQVSDATIWRALKRLDEAGLVEMSGSGRATVYRLSEVVAIRKHLQVPARERTEVGYRREFLDRYEPRQTWYLSESERAQLRAVGVPNSGFDPNAPAGTFARQVLEKLLIDLSWASSRMEGNTYSLLDTERLIQFGEEAAGKDRAEVVMILNHKEAIRYVVDNIRDIRPVRKDLLDVHALLSRGLLGDPAQSGKIRSFQVEIGQSSYRPLVDSIEIGDALDAILEKASLIEDPFEASFFLLVHIPYLQAFADVNKRTSRVVANVPLLKANLAPIAFTTMNDTDYIEGLLGIYELNSIALLKRAFVSSYTSSAKSFQSLAVAVGTPGKAALENRDLSREIVRRCVLEYGEFRESDVRVSLSDAGVPAGDISEVTVDIRRQFEGLHEGNLILYDLEAADLERISARNR